jgi:hypothetical protein
VEGGIKLGGGYGPLPHQMPHPYIKRMDGHNGLIKEKVQRKEINFTHVCDP